MTQPKKGVGSPQVNFPNAHPTQAVPLQARPEAGNGGGLQLLQTRLDPSTSFHAKLS